MRPLLGIGMLLLAAAPAAATSGGRSWAAAEVTLDDVADGYSRRVGGVRVRVHGARVRAGGFGCNITIEATPAVGARFRATETLALRFYDARGRVLEARTGIGFGTGAPRWGGGTMNIGLGTGAPPPGTATVTIELECVKLETRRLPLKRK